MQLKARYLALLFAEATLAARYEKVLLSKVNSLTLRSDQNTAGRRLAPIPQLKCVGGDARGLYEVDVMRCVNMGGEYGEEDIAWSCTANIPGYFKLGSTDVLCEGFNSPDDKYVLKGSCGVEYRLVLTEAGLEKYGGAFSSFRNTGGNDGLWGWFFAIVFVSVLIFIAYSAWTGARAGLNTPPRPQPRGGSNNGRPWFGGGGDGQPPPPPYDPRPPGYKTTAGASEQWRPGFWSGLAAGAAGSYLMGGNRNQNQNQNRPVRPATYAPVFGGGDGGSSFSESSSSAAERRESTGFGQTRRR